MAKNLGTRIGIMHQGALKHNLLSDEVSHADLTRLYIDIVKQNA